MKESLIRSKAIEILEKDKWICWYPAKSRWKKEQDIFGVFDLISVNYNIVRFIQLTTLPNIRAREKKVKGFVKKHKTKLNSEVWGWNSKKKEFKIIKVK